MTATGTAERDARDRPAVADLVAAWAAHRDRGRWDDLAALFAPDGRVALTWTTATAAEFVGAAREQADGPLRSKHVVGTPWVVVRGDRAIAETDAVLVTEHLGIDLGATTHSRFLDRLVRTGTGWAIAHRASVYDASGFTFPFGAVAVDEALARRFPREYAALAYLLVHAGHTPSPTSPTRGGDAERTLRDDQRRWLDGELP